MAERKHSGSLDLSSQGKNLIDALIKKISKMDNPQPRYRL